MMLGDTECDAGLKHFLKYGAYPETKRCKGIYNRNFDSFDELNYLECNYNAYFENPRRHIWGY